MTNISIHYWDNNSPILKEAEDFFISNNKLYLKLNKVRDHKMEDKIKVFNCSDKKFELWHETAQVEIPKYVSIKVGR